MNMNMNINMNLSKLYCKLYHFEILLLMQIERDRLLTEVENLSASSDGQTQKMQELQSQKLKSLEAQVSSRYVIMLIWTEI